MGTLIRMVKPGDEGDGKIALFFFKNHACFDKIYMLVLNIRT